MKDFGLAQIGRLILFFCGIIPKSIKFAGEKVGEACLSGFGNAFYPDFLRYKMIRKIFLFLAVISYVTATAGIVPRAEALLAARRFMSSRGMSLAPTALPAYSAPQKMSAAQNAASYYVFNADGGKGYVIVSGDDRTLPILAYSTQGSFDAAAMPDNMRAWLQYYADGIEALGSDSTPSAATETDADGVQPVLKTAFVSPLLATKWDQTAPYWNMCPSYGYTRCCTGCVATAMAQVLYHHRHPAAITADIPAYTTTSLRLNVEGVAAGTAIDWDMMLTDYSGSCTDSQAAAVARLMKYCGAAVSMDYGTFAQGGSLAYCPDIAIALKTYFDYDSRLHQATRSNYTIAEWNALLLKELENGRPVIYFGQSTGGAHCFVIDGYEGDETAYFHVNWGWSGEADGYYAISVLNPYSTDGAGAGTSADGYSFSQKAVIGIQKSGASADIPADTYAGSLSFENFSLADGYLSFGMWNNTEATCNYHIGALCEDAAGNVQETEFARYSNVTLKPGYGWNNVEMNMNDILDPFSLTEGDYRLFIYGEVLKQNLTTEGRRNYVKVSVDASGARTYELYPTQQLTVPRMLMPAEPEVDVSQRITATVSNAGDEYNGMLYVFADPVQASSKTLIMKTGAAIPAGGTADVEIFLTPTIALNYAVTVTTDAGGNNVIGKGILKLEPDPIITPGEDGAGDVDDNGRLDISDVVALCRYIITRNSRKINKENADVNKDGRINVTDVSDLVRRIVLY